MRSLHQRRTHSVYMDGCFGCQVSTISVASNPDVRAIDRREAVLSKDLEAYKRMRLEGLFPADLTGAARLEREARSPLEVEHPTLMSKLKDVDRDAIAEAVTFNPSIPDVISAKALR